MTAENCLCYVCSRNNVIKDYLREVSNLFLGLRRALPNPSDSGPSLSIRGRMPSEKITHFTQSSRPTLVYTPLSKISAFSWTNRQKLRLLSKIRIGFLDESNTNYAFVRVLRYSLDEQANVASAQFVCFEMTSDAKEIIYHSCRIHRSGNPECPMVSEMLGEETSGQHSQSHPGIPRRKYG